MKVCEYEKGRREERWREVKRRRETRVKRERRALIKEKRGRENVIEGKGVWWREKLEAYI